MPIVIYENILLNRILLRLCIMYMHFCGDLYLYFYISLFNVTAPEREKKNPTIVNAILTKHFKLCFFQAMVEKEKWG